MTQIQEKSQSIETVIMVSVSYGVIPSSLALHTIVVLEAEGQRKAIQSNNDPERPDLMKAIHLQIQEAQQIPNRIKQGK